MKPHIPEPVQQLLQKYTALVNQSLPGFIHAFYIVGSIAFGEFNEHFSDLDFVAMLLRRANEMEIEQLRQIHRQIEKTYPRWKMSGSYLRAEDLGRFDGEVEPYPHYHEGILRPRERSALNAVTWWELKNHGIAVIGADAQALSFSVDWERLVADMRDNLNTYWASWTGLTDSSCCGQIGGFSGRCWGC